MLTSPIARAAAAAAGGAAMGFGFPPQPVWVLVVAGVALVLTATADVGARTGAWLGLLSGFAFFVVLIGWLDVIGVDAWLGLAFVQALYWIPLGAGLAVVSRLRLWPLWAAAVWVAVELVRATFPFGGFPWGRLAFGMVDSPLLPYAAVAGTTALAVVVVLLASVVVVVTRAGLQGDVSTLAGAVAGTAALVLGAWVVPNVDGSEADSVQAALIQGNVPEPGLDFLGEPRQVLQNHANATRALAEDVSVGAEPAPDLVVWPENSSDIDPFRDEAAFDEIDGAVAAIQAPTLVGAVVETDDPTLVENSGIVWDPEAGPGDRYVKRHPVPFGEYIPFRGAIAPLIDRLDRIPRDFVAGDDVGVLTLGPAVVGDVICFEIAYDDVVADVVDGGAEIIVVQTNNATYATTGQPEQQFAISRLRAVEHGRTVLVASTSGISGVIGPDGEVQRETGELVPATINVRVPLLTSSTLASGLGRWPEWVFAAVGVIAVAVGSRRDPREDTGRGTSTQPVPPAVRP